MGNWLFRITSFILVILLAGGSTLAAFCESLCSEVSAADPSADTAQSASGHHHGGTAAQPESSPSRASVHDHDRMPADPSGRLTPARSAMVVSCTTNCCTGLVRPRTSLAADRADTALILRSFSDAARSLVSLPEPDRATVRFGDGSPPGPSFCSRPVVVLRI